MQLTRLASDPLPRNSCSHFFASRPAFTMSSAGAMADAHAQGGHTLPVSFGSSQPNKDAKSNTIMWAAIGGAVVLLAVASLVAYFLLKSNPTTPSSADPIEVQHNLAGYIFKANTSEATGAVALTASATGFASTILLQPVLSTQTALQVNANYYILDSVYKMPLGQVGTSKKIEWVADGATTNSADLMQFKLVAKTADATGVKASPLTLSTTAVQYYFLVGGAGTTTNEYLSVSSAGAFTTSATTPTVPDGPLQLKAPSAS